MMRTTVSALALTLALGACSHLQPPPAATETVVETETVTAPAELTAEQKAEISKELNAWFDASYEEYLQKFSPMQLTFLGRKDHNDEIDCFSLACQDEQVEFQKAKLAEMESKFNYDDLSDEDKLSWDILEYQTHQAEEGQKFKYNGFVYDQMNGVHSFMPQFLISFHEVDTPEDMKAYVSRIKAAARALNEGTEVARESAAKGVHAPKFAYDIVAEESRKIITGAPFTDGDDSDIYADVKEELAKLVADDKMTQEEADAMQADAAEALKTDFKQAYENIIDFVTEDEANSPDSTQPVGAYLQPDGADYYNYRLEQMTTTNLTADQIHKIGLSEVARLRGEMEAIKDKVGFEGTLNEFFTMLRDSKDDERFYYPNTDEGRQAYLDDATAVIENIKAKLPEFFGILPKADIVVKRVEPFREQAGAAQHYFPGTPDGSRPGTYYVHLLDMTAMPKGELEVIAYHEGIPGHHMQISIAQELKNVPMFRTQAGFTAYVEGWALYSEWLAKEFPGTYEDPYSDFGRLGSEMWRAIRLVLDTGIHSKGWTEEQAVQYFLDNSAITEAQARSEVKRYIVTPGQATAYKVGMMKIQELRRHAETELGDKFDIRAFHDTVLSGGALPLDLLERRVDTWIESVKAE